MPDYIIFPALPLISAILYTISSLAIKSAMKNGAGAIRSVFLNNCMFVPCFLPLLFFSEAPFNWEMAWLPAIAGFSVFLGQLFTALAIRVGDVTIQAPMMGIKIIQVAFLTIIIGAGVVAPSLWIAAGLSTIAIFILGSSGFKNRRAVLFTALFAFSASFCFALQDVIIQKYAHIVDSYNFLVQMTWFQCMFSFFLIFLFRGRLSNTPKKAWPWLIFGAFMMGFQGVIFVLPIALIGRATDVNVLYSSRGIWSIILVWFVGHWFGNEEKSVGKKIMIQRLIGASLLFAAIVLVLF